MDVPLGKMLAWPCFYFGLNLLYFILQSNLHESILKGPSTHGTFFLNRVLWKSNRYKKDICMHFISTYFIFFVFFPTDWKFYRLNENIDLRNIESWRFDCIYFWEGPLITARKKRPFSTPPLRFVTLFVWILNFFLYGSSRFPKPPLPPKSVT